MIGKKVSDKIDFFLNKEKADQIEIDLIYMKFNKG